jgi:hypothetical protein
VTPTDTSIDGRRTGATDGDGVERHEARTVELGGLTVRRLLPKRARRTIGAWCFVDHFGPTPPGDPAGMEIGPHPHIGLHTVTWLLAGEVLHTDSLGSEQPIRPGQLNLMTAGRGIAHAEESTARGRPLHGVQLWVAQPSSTRDGDPGFEHHGDLPVAELDAGHATVLLGELVGARSPARADTDIVGAAVELRPSARPSVIGLDPGFEHAVVVVDGALEVGGVGDRLRPGELLHLGPGRDELVLAASAGAHALVLGGVPFPEPVLMWWNFVARDRAEVAAARAAWAAGDPRFGDVASASGRVPAPPLV